MKRFIAVIFILIGFISAWQMLSVIQIKVVGQPSSTGLIATQIEQPFFASLQSNTSLPIEVAFKSLDKIGFKDTFQLPMMKDGVFDLASLRLIQNTQNEITLNGLDLTGLNLNTEKARTLADAYLPVVDKRLQEKYHVKLLGLWSFGPQELFCSKPISKLADFKGIKIRVANESLAQFRAYFGAIPTVIPFDETRVALESKIVDCAISSVSSASSAGWFDFTKYYLPVHFGTGINAYAITLSKWNLLSDKQQDTLQSAFNKHIDNIWKFSQKNLVDTQNCMLSKDVCKEKKYKIITVDLTAEDQAHMNKQFKNLSFRKWATACNQEYPQCENEWLRLVGSIAGLE